MSISAHSPATALHAVLRDAVDERSLALGFAPDAAQRRAISEVTAAVAAAITGHNENQRESAGSGTDAACPPTRSGVYVWGPAGRGKTWLLSTVVDAIPADAFVGNTLAATAVAETGTTGTEHASEPDHLSTWRRPVRRYRTHFHSFFQTLHRVLWRLRDRPSPFEAAVDELYRDAVVVFFDEFHVHDSGDARLLQGILDTLIRRGVVVLATSNYEPRDLLPNPTYHHLFDEGIATIENNFTVVELGEGPDFRRTEATAVRSGFASGSWLAPGTAAQLAAAGLDRPSAESISVLEAGGHAFTALSAADGRVWFHADDLIESSTAISDFVGWSNQFSEWVLDELPPLNSMSSAARQRLVGLIDVLSDADCRLTVISAVDRAQFERDSALPLDAERMLSRLAMLGRG